VDKGAKKCFRSERGKRSNSPGGEGRRPAIGRNQAARKNPEKAHLISAGSKAKKEKEKRKATEKKKKNTTLPIGGKKTLRKGRPLLTLQGEKKRANTILLAKSTSRTQRPEGYPTQERRDALLRWKGSAYVDAGKKKRIKANQSRGACSRVGKGKKGQERGFESEL